MDLSIIIINYNVRDFLRQAIESIQKSAENFNYEIIVVDNASDDGSVEMIEKDFPSIKLIKNTLNIGFGKANNQAMKIATGKYFLLINPDTLVQEDTISKLFKYLEENKNVGIVGCKILNADGTIQLACRRSIPTPWIAFTKSVGLSKLFPKSKIFSKYNLTYLDENKITEVEALSGSFMFFPKEIYERTAGFDEQYFMYGEDLDFCYRVHKMGLKIIYNPETQIIHYKGESAKRSSIDELNYFYNAMKIFYRRHFESSFIFNLIIETAISAQYIIASLQKFLRSFLAPLIDFIFAVISIFIAEFLRKNNIYTFPNYAYPWVYILPPLLILASLYFSKVYSTAKLSISRTFVGVSFGLLIISTATAFVKEFAFSRAMLIYFYFFTVLFLGGWRFLFWFFGAPQNSKPRTLFSRRALIIGISDNSLNVLSKLRMHIFDGYDIIGFIDTTHQKIGSKLNGVPILGSNESVSKIVNEHKITDLIFSLNDLKYESMLSIISATSKDYLTYSVVPGSLELIISKSGINYFGNLPFISINYNQRKYIYKILKKMFDLFVGILLLIIVSPFVYLFSNMKNKNIVFSSAISLLIGDVSTVGRSLNSTSSKQIKFKNKLGLTSITELMNTENFSEKEKEELELYYNGSQSILLDLEIFLKAISQKKIFN